MSAREDERPVVVQTGGGGTGFRFAALGALAVAVILFFGGQSDEDLQEEREQNRQQAQEDFDTMTRINRGTATESEMQQAIQESQADVTDLKNRLNPEHRSEIQSQQQEIESSNLPLPQRAQAWLILEQRARELRDQEIDQELQEGGGFLDIPDLNTILAGIGIGMTVVGIALAVAAGSVAVGAALIIGGIGITLAALWNAVANNSDDPVANEIQQNRDTLESQPSQEEQPIVESGTNTIFGSLRGAANATSVNLDSLAVVTQILENQIGFNPDLPLRVDGSAAPDIIQPLQRTSTQYIQDNPGEALIAAMTWVAFTAPGVNADSLLATANEITQSMGEEIANTVAAQTVGQQIRPAVEPADLNPAPRRNLAPRMI